MPFLLSSVGVLSRLLDCPTARSQDPWVDVLSVRRQWSNCRNNRRSIFHLVYIKTFWFLTRGYHDMYIYIFAQWQIVTPWRSGAEPGDPRRLVGRCPGRPPPWSAFWFRPALVLVLVGVLRSGPSCLCFIRLSPGSRLLAAAPRSTRFFHLL